MGFESIAAAPVSISYNDLFHAPEKLQAQIERAFGSDADCLGLIIVTDLPKEYPALRERLLKIAYEFAALDEAAKQTCVDASSRYSFGWSHGKEIMNGQPDTLKGSYYANPVVDFPDVSEELRNEFPEYYGKNVWPKQTDLEQAFKELGRFVFDVGILLAKACQPFVGARLKDATVSLPDMISKSQTTKGRLLHYFPPPPDAPKSEALDSWCGMHLDHSVLTGLCSAMYLLEGNPPQVVPSPSPASGLYIKTRGGVVAKANIPVDALAFQTGEALEIATEARLRATPHFVHVGHGGDNASKISRETFALFMQPNVEQVLATTKDGVTTFGSFSKQVFSEHYEQM